MLCNVYAYPFIDNESNKVHFWRDVGTIDSYYDANIDLVSITPELNLYDEKWPIWTYQEQLPPAKFVFNDNDCRGYAVDSMVSGGCIISGANVRHSLLFSKVIIEQFSKIDNSIIMQNVTIGRNCKIKNAIVDKSCIIPDNFVIGYDLEEDKKRFYISEKGRVVVTPEMLGQRVHHAR